jgi:biotin operon repressor
MTLGLYLIRTVSTPPVYAKDAPITQPRPRMSMAEDAKRCNARLNKLFQSGHRPEQSQTEDPNAARVARAKERDRAVAPKVVALLHKRGAMSGQKLADELDVSFDIIRRVVTKMLADGLIIRQNKRNGWRLA